MSTIDGTEPCVECGQQTDKICSWCGVPVCEQHRYTIPVVMMTVGGMRGSTVLEDYCESCMPDDEEDELDDDTIGREREAAAQEALGYE